MQIDFGPDLIRTDKYDVRVDQLRVFLLDRGWVTAKELKSVFGWTDRTSRALAEAADGDVLSGQQGYKLTRQATPEELLVACNQWQGQIEKMAKRLSATRRKWHAAGHRPPETHAALSPASNPA